MRLILLTDHEALPKQPLSAKDGRVFKTAIEESTLAE